MTTTMMMMPVCFTEVVLQKATRSKSSRSVEDDLTCASANLTHTSEVLGHSEGGPSKLLRQSACSLTSDAHSVVLFWSLGELHAVSLSNHLTSFEGAESIQVKIEWAWFRTESCTSTQLITDHQG